MDIKMKWISYPALLGSLLLFNACKSEIITPPTVGAGGGASIGSGGGSVSDAAAPSGLVSFTTSSTTISLRWTDNATDETEFRVYRSFGGSGNFVLVATLEAGSIRWVDSTLFPSTTYFYRVTAYKAGVGETTYTTANATTFSGDWKEVDGSVTGRGLSASPVPSGQSSYASVATSSTGVTMVVWQQATDSGTDQVYGMIFNPSLYSSDGTLVGWQPIIMNAVLESRTEDGTSGLNTAITYSSKETSIIGKGISQATGNAQEPVVVYNSTRDEFAVVWQENRSGYFQVVGRRIKIRGYNSLGGGGFYAQMTDSAITANDVAAGNPETDDGFTSTVSTWVLSEVATPANQQLHPAIASVDDVVYGVWQNFTGGLWQIYGTKTTLAAAAAYPAIDTNPAIASPIAAEIVPIDDVGAISNAGTGISQTVVANEHSFYPSIAIAQDSAVGSGNNNVYITWQQYDDTTDHWEIKSIGCLALCVANFGAILDVAASATADVQHPKVATTIDGYPVIAFDGNTSGNYEVYVRKGDSNNGVLPANYATITDTYISSGDLTTGGISDTSTSSQWPSISIYNQDIFVAWQDANSSNVLNIYVKKYEASVPAETAAWKGMSASDEGSGVSSSSLAGQLPKIHSTQGGKTILVWQDFVTPSFSIFLRQY